MAGQDLKSKKELGGIQGEKTAQPVGPCLFIDPKKKQSSHGTLKFNCQNHLFFLMCLFIFGSVVSSLLCMGFLQLLRAGSTFERQRTCSRPMGFSSCCSWAWLLCSVWDLPGPVTEPVSPALAGRFLTTGLPGKPHQPCIFTCKDKF